MSKVISHQPNEFLDAINTFLGSSYKNLSDAWLAFLQNALSSSSKDVDAMEWQWLDSFTSLGTPYQVQDQWWSYLKDIKGYTGLTIPDMLKQGLLDGTLFGYQYLLRFIGTGVADQTFTNGQVLDDVGEGVLDGSLTANVDSGSLNITSGALNVVGKGSWASPTGVGEQVGISSEVVTGKAYHCRVEGNNSQAANGIAFGLWTSPLESMTTNFAANLGAIVWVGNTSLGVQCGVDNLGFYHSNLFPWAINTAYDYLMVVDDSDSDGFIDKVYFYAKVATDTEYTLLYIWDKVDDEELYLAACSYYAVQTAKFHKITSPSTLYTDQITPVFYDEFDGADPDIGSYVSTVNRSVAGGYCLSDTDSANVILVVDQTPFLNGHFQEAVFNKVGTPSDAGAIYMHSRYSTNSDRLSVRHDSGAGTITLEQRIGGANTDLDSASFSMTTGVDYNFKLSDDTSNCDLYIDDVATLNGTSAISMFTATRISARRVNGSNYVKAGFWKVRTKSGYTFEGID